MKSKQKTIHQLFDESLAQGWKMTKKISSGSSGFFSYTPSTYDNRTVYNRSDLDKLSKEGFLIDQDIGVIAINILLRA